MDDLFGTLNSRDTIFFEYTVNTADQNPDSQKGQYLAEPFIVNGWDGWIVEPSQWLAQMC